MVRGSWNPGDRIFEGDKVMDRDRKMGPGNRTKKGSEHKIVGLGILESGEQGLLEDVHGSDLAILESGVQNSIKVPLMGLIP